MLNHLVPTPLPPTLKACSWVQKGWEQLGTPELKDYERSFTTSSLKLKKILV
jgi:hypothetical protein